MRWWGWLPIPIVAAACSGEPPARMPPEVFFGGLADDGALPVCIDEPDRAHGSLLVRNDSDLQGSVSVGRNGVTFGRVTVPPRATATVPVSAPADVDSAGLSMVWGNEWIWSSTLPLVRTVDERLIDIEPARTDIIGGPIAHVVVRNRANARARFELAVERGLAISERERELPARGSEMIRVDVLDAKLWYARSGVRVVGASCGDGPPKIASTALSPFSAHAAVQIAAGRFHTCVRTAAGAVVCWGANGASQLARPSKEALDEGSPDPLVVTGLESGVEAVVAGGVHTCALRAGKVLCWGGSGDGQAGATKVVAWPAAIQLAQRATAVFAGGATSCATVEDGELLCWGRTGWAVSSRTPTSMGVMGVTEMAIGTSQWCALDGAGALWCWGVLPGDGSVNAARPVLVSRSIRRIVAGDEFTCGIHEGDEIIAPGSAVCWGRYDAVLAKTPQDRSTDGDRGRVRSLSAQGRRLCRATDKVTCGAPFAEPIETMPRRVDTVVNGQTHTCAMFDGGKVACVGTGEHGELGTKTVSGNVAGFDGP